MENERRIEHVVVLMLENRSHDHLFAYLDGSPPFDPTQYPNPMDPADPTSEPVYPSSAGTCCLPLDPPHSHKSVMQQLAVDPLGRARMNGFVAAYARKAMGLEERAIFHWTRIGGVAVAAAAAVTAIAAGVAPAARRYWPIVLGGLLAAVGIGLPLLRRKLDGPVDAVIDPEEKKRAEALGRRIMECLEPDQIPVLARLAKEFARCEAWHASVPGETWPNRNFLHAGTSDGTVEIEPGFYESPTIFEQLEGAGHTWRIYFDAGIPHVWAFKNLWDEHERWANWFLFDGVSDLDPGFEAHVAAGDLPAYSFIEPRHQPPGSNSQHPGNNRVEPTKDETSDFERGELLVARVYEALRRNPELFAKTLLVVTHDEHGGFWDRARPPTGVPAPAPLTPRPHWTRRLIAFFVERRQQHFNFRMLGVRVPAVVISPWIEPGTVDPTVYDHTSVIATLRKRFPLKSDRLTDRDYAANPFDHLVEARTSPRTGPELPDLSPDLTAALRAQAEERVRFEGLAVQQEERDTFDMQLRALAELVDQRLAAMPPSTAERTLGPLAASQDPRIAADRHGDVIARFMARAAEARRG